MAARKKKPVDVVGKMVSMLDSLESEDRLRAIQATLTLLGEDAGAVLEGRGGEGPPGEAGAVSLSRRAEGAASPQQYFDMKEPRTKVEELAVAARYREEKRNAASSSRKDIEEVIGKARRDFDANNFRRDLANARRKNLFTKSTARDVIQLSHYGQKYVDALPDRQAAKQVRRPRGAGRRKGRRKKKTRRRAH